MSIPADWLSLHSNELTVSIDPQGAQLSVLRDQQGRDLLWDGDAAFWNGRAPILFPIVGALHDGHYQWQGQRYALPRHGFARGRRFEVLEHDDISARLRLCADPQTLVAYPFRFELEVSFRLAQGRLSVSASVHNPGDAPLPASLGFHPALRWPLPGAAARDAHYLEFEQDEPAPIRRLDQAGLLSGTPQATPVEGRRLALHDGLFAEDVIIFDQLASRALSYGSAAGPRLRMEFPDATHLGLWTKPGAGFLCIEPWRGVADPQGFSGTFDTKPGVFHVPPGGRSALTMHLTLQPGASPLA
ncbi:MAG: aldose 1-epimerase family protein [Steroidobacteraceae bacterium]